MDVHCTHKLIYYSEGLTLRHRKLLYTIVSIIILCNSTSARRVRLDDVTPQAADGHQIVADDGRTNLRCLRCGRLLENAHHKLDRKLTYLGTTKKKITVGDPSRVSSTVFIHFGQYVMRAR